MAFLTHHMLVALPALQDPEFARSVALICQHDGNGAMGVVVNRPSEYTLGDVLEQMGIVLVDPRLRAQRVLAGGPVHPERGFVRADFVYRSGNGSPSQALRQAQPLPRGESLTTFSHFVHAAQPAASVRPGGGTGFFVFREEVFYGFI